MGSFNVTVGDSSPLISYAPAHAWVDTPANDTSVSMYQGASLHRTSQQGATATFKFNGTGVWLYGVHRQGYGAYSISVDGHTVSSGNASSLDAVFNQLMGGSSGLNMGEHTVVLQHSGGGYIDLDALIFETQLSQADHQIKTTVVDDNDSRIAYTPSGKWPVAHEDYFSNSSLHWTFTEGAQATLEFTGDAVAVYGGASYDHGDYEVTLDGQTKQYNGGDQSLDLYHPMSLLYFAGNLGSGNHKITLTSKSSTGYFDLDSITIYEVSDAKDTNSGSSSSGGMTGNLGNFHIHQASAENAGSPTPSSDNASASSSSTAAAVAGAMTTNKGGLAKSIIVGIVVASVLGFISLVLIIIFVITRVRRSRARRAAAAGGGRGDLESPVLPIQEPKLDVGADGYFNDQSQKEQKRTTRFSMKSFRSRWSQASFADTTGARKAEPVPPLPPMPSLSKVPQLTVPVPELKHKRDSLASDFSKDDDIRSDLVDYYYGRQSTISTETSSTVGPHRPARPPGLDLTPTLSKFDRVPL